MCDYTPSRRKSIGHNRKPSPLPRNSPDVYKPGQSFSARSSLNSIGEMEDLGGIPDSDVMFDPMSNEVEHIELPDLPDLDSPTCSKDTMEYTTKTGMSNVLPMFTLDDKAEKGSQTKRGRRHTLKNADLYLLDHE